MNIWLHKITNSNQQPTEEKKEEEERFKFQFSRMIIN